jgi:transcriptional regulator with GAF, ATPase, and Fis domain
VRHFVQGFARRMQKSIDHVSVESMNALLGYSWPGNVRELQNLIERAVILSPGKVLRLPISELNRPDSWADIPGRSAASQAVTLKDAEVEHILQALAETNWIIGGLRGAAARLGLKRTTLISKMQRLGISRLMA